MKKDIQEICRVFLPNGYAENMQFGVNAVLGRLECPRRTEKALEDFFQFVSEQDVFLEEGEDLALFFSVYQQIEFGEPKKKLETVDSDIRALREGLFRLMGQGALPRTVLPDVLKVNKDVFKGSCDAVNKVLGGISIPSPTEIGSSSTTLLLEQDTQTFITNLVDEMRAHRDIILKVARTYLVEANNRFDFGLDAIEKVDPTLFDDPQLFHPTEVSIKGQSLSLFSKYLPNKSEGLQNLIAYLHHHHHGLVNRDFSGANNTLYYHTNQYELREHLGTSGLAATAAQIIIIIEGGINADSLRNLRFKKNGDTCSFFEPHSSGYYLEYEKKRARTTIRKDRRLMDNHKVNIKYAFDYLERTTAPLRKHAGDHARYLFIQDSSAAKSKPQKMSSMVFKGGFIRLLEEAKTQIAKNSEWCEGLPVQDTEKKSWLTINDIERVLEHKPNAKKLRTTEGILHWFDAGGCPRAAARYLGNTEEVAIKNYLPEQLQVAVYTQQIKRFQNVIIAAATDGEDYQLAALNLRNEKELVEYLERLEKRNPNWRLLGKAGHNKNDNADTNADNTPEPKKQLTLVMCAENIALLHAAREIHQKKLDEGSVVPPTIKKFATACTSLFTYIKSNGGRTNGRIWKEGIDLFNESQEQYMTSQFTVEEAS